MNLEISDLIRSKTVQPRQAMRSLKRRISNTNPNVQIAALKLTDTCVKNGGTHFLTEVASKEFMDDLVSLLKAYGPAAPNQDVKTKILELVQAWAGAAEKRHDLFYIGETYRNLQREGFRFPPKVDISSSMLDSSAPPEWIDSDVCMRCRKAFTFTNRKHHCRNCGNVFDGQCSTKTIPLPHLGIMTPVRVDDGCYARLTEKARNISLPLERSLSRGNASIIRDRGFMQPRDARVDNGFDEDLQKALKMSLDDVQGQGGAGFVSQSQLQAHRQSPKVNGHVRSQSPSEEDEDPDLKAAIAASIKEMEEQKKRHAANLKKQASSNAPASTAGTVAVRNQYELSPVEEENINLFSTLVDRLQHQPSGTVLREPQIQELYDSIGTLRPKLARSYGETMSKHDTLLDLHSKLAAVVRYYDRMLDDRLSSAYGQQPLGGYRAPSQPASSNLYPNIQAEQQQQTLGANVESFYGVNSSSSYQNSYQQPQATTSYSQQTQSSQIFSPQHDSAPTPKASYSQGSLPSDPQPGYAQPSMAPSDTWTAPGRTAYMENGLPSSPHHAPQIIHPSQAAGPVLERRPTWQSQEPIPEYSQHQVSPRHQQAQQNFYDQNYASSPQQSFHHPSQQQQQQTPLQQAGPYPHSNAQYAAPPPSQPQPIAATPNEQSPYPDLTSPPQQVQQYQQQQQEPPQQQQPPPPQQNPLWQQQTSAPPSSQTQFQPNNAWQTQNSFPQAPRHEPAIVQQPKMEEALIEL